MLAVPFGSVPLSGVLALYNSPTSDPNKHLQFGTTIWTSLFTTIWEVHAIWAIRDVKALLICDLEHFVGGIK